jgi:foldase protein PrsA
LEKESGQATLENLVIKELIFQEARKKGITISQEDIQKEIDNISEMIEAQGSTIDAALSMQGQTIDDLKENINIQKTAEEILKDEIQVSDEEILEYFEENKEFYEDREFVDLKEEIKEQLFQEKLQVKFSELLENLKNESDIKYLVTF